MADEFFRRLEIPYFDDEIMDNLIKSVEYRVDRRFFDNDLIDGTKEISTSEHSFPFMWHFAKSSNTLTNPAFFWCIKPHHRTDKRVDHWKSIDSLCALTLPILPQHGTRTSVMLYDTAESLDPVGIASCESGKPILFDSTKKWCVMNNESDHWMVVLMIFLHVEYNLALELINDGRLFKDIEVRLIADEGM